MALLTVVLLVGIIILIYMFATKPAGELVVVYEFRPPAPTPATTAAPAQIDPPSR